MIESVFSNIIKVIVWTISLRLHRSECTSEAFCIEMQPNLIPNSKMNEEYDAYHVQPVECWTCHLGHKVFFSFPLSFKLTGVVECICKHNDSQKIHLSLNVRGKSIGVL